MTTPIASLLLCLLVMTSSAAAAFAASADKEAEYFDAVSAALRDRGVARPVVFIDLDRLDANLATVMSHVQKPLNFRVVEKSLPSLPLIRYILEHSGATRVMVFHYPFLPLMLSTLPSGTSYLFGKTVLPDGVKEYLASLTSEQRALSAEHVQWLIDSPRTLADYLELFHGTRFAINVEIDVGLKRGGAENLDDFEKILSLVEAHRDALRFDGLMGYDGHVIHAPAPDILGWHEAAVRSAFRRVEKRYGKFVAYLREKHPSLYAEATTFNGAGSNTYELYKPGSPVTDIAAGSALLKSTDFDVFTLKDHLPAVFVATPVLKKRDSVAIPFLDHFLKFIPDLLDWGNTSYITYGGSWNSPAEYPRGLRDHPLLKDGGMPMVPNQGMIYGKPSRPLDVGDYVYFRPRESDAIFQFEEILLVRGGRISGVWKPFERRY